MTNPNLDPNIQDPTLSTLTEDQPPAKTKEELLQDQVNALAEQNKLMLAQMNNINTNLQNMNSNNNGRVIEPEPEVTNDDYNADPVATIGRIVAKQTAPLQAAAFQMMRQNALIGIKSNLSAKYKDFPVIESIWDHLMNNVTQVNLESGESVYIMAKGAYVQQHGKVPDINGGTQPPKSETLPPHLRPNRTQPANTGGGGENGLPKLEPLNENEERLRREQGLTHYEFLYFGGRMSQTDYDKFVQFHTKK